MSSLFPVKLSANQVVGGIQFITKWGILTVKPLNKGNRFVWFSYLKLANKIDVHADLNMVKLKQAAAYNEWVAKGRGCSIISPSHFGWRLRDDNTLPPPDPQVDLK